MNGHFIVSRGARDVFLTEQELLQQASAGLLSPIDRVYHPLKGWLYAREVAEVEAALLESTLRGKRAPPDSVVLVPVNRFAIAGFLLGALGVVPFLGLIFSGLGLYCSARGLGASQLTYGSGYGLSAVGLLLSLLFFLTQLGAAFYLRV